MHRTEVCESFQGRPVRMVTVCGLCEPPVSIAANCIVQAGEVHVADGSRRRRGRGGGMGAGSGSMCGAFKKNEGKRL